MKKQAIQTISEGASGGTFRRQRLQRNYKYGQRAKEKHISEFKEKHNNDKSKYIC